MEKIRLTIIDVFDCDDENSNASKLLKKYEVISILLLIILICLHPLIRSVNLYNIIYIFLALIFSFQFLLRAYVYISNKHYERKKCIKFLVLDFFGGIIPLAFCIFSNFDTYLISLLSVIKILRLFDVLPGFASLKRALNDKNDEILYSLLLVAFGSFILSCFIYFIFGINPIKSMRLRIRELNINYKK